MKPVKSITGSLSSLTKTREGQHVGIRNTEHDTLYCVHYETKREPRVGDEWILPEEILMDLAFKVQENKDVFFGIIFPNEKKFNKKKWNINEIFHRLASFTQVSKVTQWGDSIYINLVENYEGRDKDEEYLITIAYNWQE